MQFAEALFWIWVFCAIFIFPFYIYKRINDLAQEIKILRGLLFSDQHKAVHKETAKDTPLTQASHVADVAKPVVESIPREKAKLKSSRAIFDLELQVGTRLPVWIGSICLIFAAFYLIQYSIELGLISLSVRLMISSLFGILLICAGHFITRLSNFGNGTRISQALLGAGIATLYLSVFAATHKYNLISFGVGLGALSAITIFCIISSLYKGAPIAVMGLVSGLVTPILFKGEASAVLIFSYIYCILLGTFIVAKKNDWWRLAAVATFGGLVWVVAWSLLYPISNTYLWLNLFVLATIGTFVTLFQAATPTRLIIALIALSLLAMMYTTTGINYGIVEWGMFSILAVGVLALTFVQADTYLPLTYMTMILLAFMIYSWNTGIAMYRLSVITWFGMLFAICGYILSSYNMLSRQKWILFTAAANLLFFYLAYLKVYIYYPESTHNYLTKVAWSSASFAFAIFWSFIARNAFNKLVENKLMDKQILNISAVIATVFFTVGLLLAINSELYTIVFAAVLTIVSLLSTKIEKATLGQITLALLIAFSAAFVFQYKLNSYIFNARPVLYYAVPALLLGLSCRFFNKNIEEHYVSIVEIMTMLLLIKLGTTLIENTIVMYAKDITISKKYLLCGLNTNFYLLLGATFTILIGKRYARKTFEIGGLALIAFAGIMILKSLVILLDITLSGASIGETPIFNALLLAYALPAFWLVLLNKQICQDSPRSSTEGLLQFCSSLLFFVWLTLCVRQYFHGGNLLAGAPSTSLEVCVYSIVWILLAIIMLILGAYYHSKQLRLLSLGLFIITIFKVFLFDAAELAGILRVLSFLGLGVSLIVIGWFYARFIFNEHDENNLQK